MLCSHHVLQGQCLHYYCSIPLLHSLPCWLQVQSDVPREKLQPRERPSYTLAVSFPPGNPIYLQGDSPWDLTHSHPLCMWPQQASDSLLRQILSMQLYFLQGTQGLLLKGLLGLVDSKQKQDYQHVYLSPAIKVQRGVIVTPQQRMMNHLLQQAEPCIVFRKYKSVLWFD